MVLVVFALIHSQTLAFWNYELTATSFFKVCDFIAFPEEETVYWVQLVRAMSDITKEPSVQNNEPEFSRWNILQ